MPETEPASFMIRAMGSEQEDFDVFFQNNVVAVGWSRVDFTAYQSTDELIHAVEDKYYSDGKTAPQVIGKKRNEVRRFKRITKGDRIIVPYRSSILLAIASGEGKFNLSDGETRDLGNQHIVSFVIDNDGCYRSIPREHLSEGFQRRLRVRGSSVTDLSEFKEEIGRIFEGETFISALARTQGEHEQKFKNDLLAFLQNGKTALQTGGIGLEKLVEELLQADGYITKIQPRNRFSGIGDADIEATRDDHVTSTKLLVQVKHHSGQTGDWGATQLTNVLETSPDLFAEYRLVLVTSGDASNELTCVCRDQDIILIDGTQLTEWIMDSLNDISPKMRSALRISHVPQLIEIQ